MRAPLACLIVLMSACGSSSGRYDTDEPVVVSADRIAGLPAPPRPLGRTTDTFQQIWTAAQLALEEPLPPPDVADEVVYTEWLERRLSPWLRERANAMARVKSRLRTLGAAPPDEQMMGAAVLAFVMEDTARQVLEAPVPTSASRPARADALRAALAEDVKPLYAAAIEAYVTCLGVEGTSAPHLHVWRAHCDERERALRRE